jgi:hypothetical protein
MVVMNLDTLESAAKLEFLLKKTGKSSLMIGDAIS